ncbi:MAG: glutamine--fructose-6-phosphate transaminase (isomerizing) [Parvibaculales bacterium]
MCGVIGITGRNPVSSKLLEALKHLEYRGYDSAGIATLHDGDITLCRSEGKLIKLEKLLAKKPIYGHTGIGHTRWATHGVPSEANAHPHATDKVAVVHNGIIENFKEMRKSLEAKGYSFKSQTDTEVVPAMITDYLYQGNSPHEAVAKTLKKVQGAFALGVIFAGEEGLIIGARRGSPLAIGIGKDEYYIGSDAVALAPLTRQISYLSEGDMAVVTPNGYDIYDELGNSTKRPIKQTNLSGTAIGKGGFPHYMLKEIHEQPTVIGEMLNFYAGEGTIHLPPLPLDEKKISRIQIVACGTSYYAGLTGRYWLESIAGLPVDVEIASEFRYYHPVMDSNALMIVLSQSGETADTLAALRYAKKQGVATLAMVNVPGSSIANEADAMLQTHAGPEIGVASTKAFTTQLSLLAVLSIHLAACRNMQPTEKLAAHLRALTEVPAKISEVLHDDTMIKKLAKRLSDMHHMLYIGRGVSYALAHEAALKMKEISYIHAEAYAAGEMKHGPIALIDEDMPVLAIAPKDSWFDKTASNIQEAAARNAQIIAVTDNEGAEALSDITKDIILCPTSHPFVAPIIYAVPMQLLAYHTAATKNTDIDQPRNLAKSVTVE